MAGDLAEAFALGQELGDPHRSARVSVRAHIALGGPLELVEPFIESETSPAERELLEEFLTVRAAKDDFADTMRGIADRNDAERAIDLFSLVKRHAQSPEDRIVMRDGDLRLAERFPSNLPARLVEILIADPANGGDWDGVLSLLGRMAPGQGMM